MKFWPAPRGKAPFLPKMNVRTYQRLVYPFVGSQHLEQLFDIPSSKELSSISKNINVYIEPSEILGLITIKLQYKECSSLEKQGWQLVDTCRDVQGVIYSYLQDSMTIVIEMDFRENWPYWAPRIKVTEIKNDIYRIIPLVSSFNCNLRTEWSPAFGFDKTLLMLLSRILEQIHYV